MRSLLTLIAVAVLLSACASNDPAPTTSTTTTVVTTTAAPATTVAPPTTAVTTTAIPTTTTTSTTTTTAPPAELLGVELELVAEIDWPLVITAPAGDSRIFVTQRGGVVRVIEANGHVLEQPFLDVTNQVKSEGVEQGLLGMVFHPDYAANGRFFIYYSQQDDDTVLVEYDVSENPDLADPTSAQELILFDQPTERHNAGMLEFGPDGYLYVAVGDGGDGGHNGQKSETLFGTILRLDVNTADPYAIPADNPFADGGGAPEVWAYGLRNPWRFSIDVETELIYIGDVGQADWEEIDVVPLADSGANFGWIYREGSMCFRAPECNDTETVLPVVEYPHSEGCSVTGGIVYRGDAIPELDGVYFYSDWCRGWIRSFRYEDGAAVDLNEWPELDPGQVNTFGTDASGELYVGTWDGKVWKLVPVRAGS